MKLKQDRYRKARGGKAQLLDLFCSECNTKIMVYQKDGDGGLHRCYLNRIFDPPLLSNLQNDSRIKNRSEMPNLVCGKCRKLIGVPMLHTDGRLAFRLINGAFHKSRSSHVSAEKVEDDTDESTEHCLTEYENQIAAKYGVSTEAISAALDRAHRSMTVVSKNIMVIDQETKMSYTVSRTGVGIINTDFGPFLLYDFRIDDIYEKYTVITRANLDSDLMPRFKSQDRLFLRIDSGCETGQLFGDKTCDCKEQLFMAMSLLAKRDEGMIIHVPNHEGRAMGIPFKLATLLLEDELDLNTVDAGRLLALEQDIDVRGYSGVICILKFFGFQPYADIELVTNNPRKAYVFAENSYQNVKLHPIVAIPNPYTLRHLKAKQDELGHIGIIVD